MANKMDRINFLNELFVEANEFARTHSLNNAEHKAEYDRLFTLDYWRDRIQMMANAADLGRSPAWKSACNWAAWQIEDETPSIDLYRWAAFQGSIFMGHTAGN